MPTGGWDEDECIIVWEDYGYPEGQNGKHFTDGRDRGLVNCHTHDVQILMGYPKGDPLPDSCEKEVGDDEDR